MFERKDKKPNDYLLRKIGTGFALGEAPGEEFVLFDLDPVADHRILQDSIFAKMRQSSFLVVANKEGYIGKAALIEIGYAIALGLQILTLEQVEDPNIKPYCRLITDVFTKAV